MHLSRAIRFGRGPVRAAAVVMLLLFLFLLACAASPELHRALHKDADHEDHQCAVTLLVTGHVGLSSCEISLPLPCAHFDTVLLFESSVVNATVALLPPGRAPPLHLS
jgi:hypothetical protein